MRTPRPESNFATFSYIFSEYLQTLKRKYDYQQGQEKIEQLGESVGVRLYELISLRERPKREIKLIEQLKFF